jgi:hypothetical protein
MGKIFDFSRLDRHSGDDEGSGSTSFSARRHCRVTQWDWVLWWSERDSFSHLRTVTGVAVACICDSGEDLSVLHARDAQRASLQSSLHARSRDQQGV